MRPDEKIKEIKTLLKDYCDKYDEFTLTVVETFASTVIILVDNEAFYEEVTVICRNKVSFIAEGDDYATLTLDAYYKNIKENYTETN